MPLDPTKRLPTPINGQPPSGWGLLIRVTTDGSIDAVVQLPTRLRTSEQVDDFVTAAGMKMSVPPEQQQELDEAERSLSFSIHQAAQTLIATGLIWKVLRTIPPDELAAIRKSMVQ